MTPQLSLFSLFDALPETPSKKTSLSTTTILSNYRLPPTGRNLAKSWIDRARDNIRANALANQIIATRSSPTEEQTQDLIKYIGFGASPLANNMFREQPLTEWKLLAETFKRDTTEREYLSARSTTQYAHYTPEWIAHTLWDAILQAGFSHGNILEPGCGTGLFIATTPEKIAKSVTFTGIEFDPIPAKISKILYPLTTIITKNFCEIELKSDYDLAIGNPPFSDTIVKNRLPLGNAGLSLHNYFILKAITALKPGGMAAFVISRYFMDSQKETARSLIADQADLLAAVRLPNGTFSADAGTNVCTDLVILRKTDEPGKNLFDRSWVHTTPFANDPSGKTHINTHFAEYPETMIGDAVMTSSAWGPTIGVSARDGQDIRLDTEKALFEQIRSARLHLPTLAQTATVIPLPAPTNVTTPSKTSQADLPDIDDCPEYIRNNSYYTYKNTLYQRQGENLVEIQARNKQHPTGRPSSHITFLKAYCGLRDTLRELLNAQKDNLPHKDLLSTLNTRYDALISLSGKPINAVETNKNGATTRPIINIFRDDPDAYLVSSIENYNDKTGEAKKRAIFTRRILENRAIPTPRNETDALSISLNIHASVNIPFIAGLLDKNEEDVINAIGDRIYHNPKTDQWELSEEYLSGNTPHKLQIAKEYAEDNPEYKRNVEALLKNQPIPVSPSDIIVDLGAPWIPNETIETFAREILNATIKIGHAPDLAIWTVKMSGYYNEIKTIDANWATADISTEDLIDHLLNSKEISIYDTVYSSGGKTSKIFNAQKTENARDAAHKINTAFSEWIWADGERADELATLYNDNYNNIIPRTFDGSHLTFPNVNQSITFYKSQKRAVWRILATGNTYIAHVVGAGKTFTMILAIMEQQRLGLVRKPVLVVPPHCLRQVANDFYLLYPTANVLVGDEYATAPSRRKEFLSLATTENWDCIILTQTYFETIEIPNTTKSEAIDEEIHNIQSTMKLDGLEQRTIKQFEKKVERLKQDRQNLIWRGDDLIDLHTMGIDQIIADEAHAYRKLSFITSKRNMRGIDSKGSKRSYHMHLAIKAIRAINPGRESIQASGTPISNTMGELHTIIRYNAPQELTRRHIMAFDAWAAQFARTKNGIELQPSGTFKRVTRFAEFINIPELTAIFRTFADVILFDDIRKFINLPNLKTGHRQIISCPPTPTYKDEQAHLAVRIKEIENRTGAPKPGDDIILTVIGDGRRLAIDPRFIRPGNPSEEESKLNIAARNVFRIWNETSDITYTNPETGEPYLTKGASQAVFLDEGTPGPAPTDKYKFQAYQDFKQTLIKLGVPESQIAFIHSAKNSTEKQKMFDAVNDGSTRIIIGSTPKLGTGANIQQRLAALHHIDASYLVSSIEQREGRLVRQGNQNAEVEIYAYVTETSMDSTMWQILTIKSGFITAIMKGDRTIRRYKENDDQTESFATAKAIASGDQRLLRLATLEQDYTSLNRLKRAHSDSIINAKRTIARNEATLADPLFHLREKLVHDYKPITEKDSIILPNGQVATNKTLCHQISKSRAEDIPKTLIATIGQIKILHTYRERIDRDPKDEITTEYHHIRETESYDLFTTKTKNIDRILTTIRNLQFRIKCAAGIREEKLQENAIAAITASKIFEHEEKYQEVTAEYTELSAQLEQEAKEAELLSAKTGEEDTSTKTEDQDSHATEDEETDA